MPTYNVFVSGQGGGVYGNTADTLPTVGDSMTPDGTSWVCRVDTVSGTEEAGAIYCSYVGEVGTGEWLPDA